MLKYSENNYNLQKKEKSMKTINSNPAIYELFIAKYYKAFDKIWYQKKDIIKVIFLKKDKIQNSLWKIILKIFNCYFASNFACVFFIKIWTAIHKLEIEHWYDIIIYPCSSRRKSNTYFWHFVMKMQIFHKIMSQT